MYNLGDPTDPTVTLGPVISVASAERISKQVAEAGKSTGSLLRILFISSALQVAAGAKKLIPSSLFLAAKAYVFARQEMEDYLTFFRSGTAFVAPQVLVDVNHCEHTVP